MITRELDTSITTATRRPGLRGWLLMLPLMLWLIVFVVAPTAIMLVYSFCEKGRLGTVIFSFTLEHYERIFVPEYFGLFAQSLAAGLVMYGIVRLLCRPPAVAAWLEDRLNQSPGQIAMLLGGVIAYSVLHVLVWRVQLDENQLKTLMRSLELAAVCTFICVAIGYPVAYFIARSDERARNLLLMLVMIPFWTNFLIRTYAWINILSTEGLLNAVLQGAHLLHVPLQMKDTMFAVIVGTVYTYLPFMILPIYGSVEKLDNSLIEAALDLGASPVRAFSKVIMPLTRPGITAGILLVFVPAVGMFAINDVLGGKKTPLVGNVIENQFKAALNKPFGSALGIILLLLFAVAFFLTLRKEEKS